MQHQNYQKKQNNHLKETKIKIYWHSSLNCIVQRIIYLSLCGLIKFKYEKQWFINFYKICIIEDFNRFLISIRFIYWCINLFLKFSLKICHSSSNSFAYCEIWHFCYTFFILIILNVTIIQLTNIIYEKHFISFMKRRIITCEHNGLLSNNLSKLFNSLIYFS